MKQAFILLQKLLPQHLLSRIVAMAGNSRLRYVKNPLIRGFIRIFKVNMSEAAQPLAEDYATFNDFFTRQLRSGARNIEGEISSPADGTVSACGDIEGNQLIQAKGVNYSLEALLAGREPPHFDNGSFITIYLSPKDYHRVHLPVAGTLTGARYISGKLFSVNKATTELVPGLFAKNERLVTRFDTPSGPMALIMVGAMIVAGIRTVWRDQIYTPRHPMTEALEPIDFKQGDEIGHFEMGSTVILLFAERLRFKVAPGDLVRMGEAIA